MFRSRWWVAGAVALLFAAPVWAQDQSATKSDDSDVSIVVTAERTPQPVSESIASASVITAKDIQQRGAMTAGDALRMVPGVTIGQNGQTGSLAVAHLRGTAMTQTLVLVDGNRITSSAFGGSADLSKLPIDDVARIEVIRGPVSSLYGSEAMGGVINIITKRPTGNGGNTTLGFGGNGRADRSVSVHNGDDRMAWRVTGSLPEFSGDRPNSRYSATDLSTGVNWSNLGGWDVSAGIEDYHDTLGLPGMTTYLTPSDHEWWKRQNANLSGRRDIWGGRLECKLCNMDQQLTERDDPNYINSRIKGVTHSGEFTFRRAFGAHQMVLGSELRSENYNDVERGSQVQDKSITNRALFYQDRFPIDSKTDCVAGLRMDDHSTAGTKMTPRLGFTRSIGNDTHVRASYSGGFRSPSLVELYYDNWGTKGNPDLRPEVSRQYEVGINTKIGVNSLDFALFSSRIKDQIIWQMTNPETFAGTFANVSRASQAGVELGWTRPIGGASFLSAAYTYIDAGNGTTKKRLDGVPHNQFSTTFSTKVHLVDLALTGRCMDKRTFSTNHAPGFMAFDLTLGYSKNAGYKPYMIIRNLTDKKYTEVFGYPAEGRSFEMGIRSSW